MVKALKSTGIKIMVAQNTLNKFDVWGQGTYCTPVLCTITASTTNPAKCGKTQVNGVKAPGNGMKYPGNGVKSPGTADNSREFPGLLC